MQRPYEVLIAWQESYALCLQIYRTTAGFPRHEMFSLVNQMRRSAYSAPMNLAEGNARRSPKEKMRFFEIALASLEELHCQCRLAVDLLYMSRETFEQIEKSIQKSSYLIMRLRNAFK